MQGELLCGLSVEFGAKYVNVIECDDMSVILNAYDFHM